MRQNPTTYIDNEAFHWNVSGDFNWGSGAPLFNKEHDVLHSIVGEAGHLIAPLPKEFAQLAYDSISRFLAGYDVRMENYHLTVDEVMHEKIISKSRELHMAELGWDGKLLCAEMSKLIGINLSPDIPDMGGDHVQVRINRPNSTDFNPPHRDGALAIWRNTINFWIPIFGCTDETRLPIAPGSHLIAESDCYQTVPRGAQINGKTYNVPAIIKSKQEEDGDWRMIRPPVKFGEALVFTPFLVHGAAVNRSQQTRIALELRLLIDAQNYPA